MVDFINDSALYVTSLWVWLVIITVPVSLIAWLVARSRGRAGRH